jgi:hypothetical protein
VASTIIGSPIVKKFFVVFVCASHPGGVDPGIRVVSPTGSKLGYFDNINRMITLTMITLSGDHFIWFTYSQKGFCCFCLCFPPRCGWPWGQGCQSPWVAMLCQVGEQLGQVFTDSTI